MKLTSWKKILNEVCSLPTAPFREDRVIEYLHDFAGRRKLRISADQAGNRLIVLPGRNPRLPRWLFAAHMDHPGFVAQRMFDDRRLGAILRGGVRPSLVKGAKVRFFVGDQQVEGTVRAIVVRPKVNGDTIATIDVTSPVPPGAAGMFDQGLARTKGKVFYSRAIDDLGGLAAALAMLDELCHAKQRPQATIALLATRAEEEAFIGAIAAVKNPKLLKKSDRIIAIECSAMQTYAPQGKGAIIRVGDRSSIFHSGLTWFLNQQATDLQQQDRRFLFQRALMPGGTCEATVYDIYGYIATSICVPLGNYHNMDLARQRIGPEFINLDDWNNMVKLFVHLAQHAHRFEPGHKPLKARIESRYNRLKRFLA